MEDVVAGVLKWMYRELFALEGEFRPRRYADVAYTDFTRDPVETLRGVYDFPYEPPRAAELILDTEELSEEECAEALLDAVLRRPEDETVFPVEK